MDVESRPSKKPPQPMDDEKRHRHRRCCLITLAVAILLALLISILAATVFRARRPITKVTSVKLLDTDISFDPLRVTFHLNVSLLAAVSVTNPNRVGFKFSDSSAFLTYRGQTVGQAPIPSGQIAAGQTLPLNLTLTVMADRFLSNSRSVVSDLVAGSIPLSTNTRISGKVPVLFFSVHVVSYAQCSMNISVSSRSLQDSDCTYKTQLSS